ncbi:hypothetical protein AX777_05805 [Sphingobium yanoikuyae]|uniref:Uncharacterized protein n=1 Tax=Sphingobium yanoikuyae TaxID=13690 RepID=A0A177JQU5_SPHYA|nr:hypothetical protein AX777_05805 [Sphingobium yanoikuyae]
MCMWTDAVIALCKLLYVEHDLSVTLTRELTTGLKIAFVNVFYCHVVFSKQKARLCGLELHSRAKLFVWR